MQLSNKAFEAARSFVSGKAFDNAENGGVLCRHLKADSLPRDARTEAQQRQYTLR